MDIFCNTDTPGKLKLADPAVGKYILSQTQHSQRKADKVVGVLQGEDTTSHLGWVSEFY